LRILCTQQIPQAVRDKAQTKKKKPKADGDELLSDAEPDDSDAAGGSLMHAVLRLCLLGSAWPKAWTWWAVAISSAPEDCSNTRGCTLQSGANITADWLLVPCTTQPADDFLAGEEEGGDEGIGADPGTWSCITLLKLLLLRKICVGELRVSNSLFAVPAAAFDCLFKSASTVHRCCLGLS
jgi:hypothetical protein